MVSTKSETANVCIQKLNYELEEILREVPDFEYIVSKNINIGKHVGKKNDLNWEERIQNRRENQSKNIKML